MDGSQASSSPQQSPNRKAFREAVESSERMARDAVPEAAREREVVDLQVESDDYFIQQERRLREGGYR